MLKIDEKSFHRTKVADLPNLLSGNVLELCTGVVMVLLFEGPG